MPWPSRLTPRVCFLQPVSAPPARAASTQAIAALRGRRRLMRRRSLTPAPGRGPLRVHPEPRRLERLEPSDGRARERTVVALLEDHPQPLERPLHAAPEPAAEAEPLLEALARGAGVAPNRDVDAGEASADRLEHPLDAALALAAASALCALDDAARGVGLDD